MNMTPEQVAREYIKRWNAADFDKLAELFADDMIWHIRGYSPQSGEYTRAQIVPMLKQFPRLPTTKPFTLDLLHVTANDKRASVEFTTDLPFKDGRVYRNQYHFLLFVEEGKIKRGHEYLCTWTAVHEGISDDIAKLFQ